MDRLEAMRIFLTVAERSGFAEAARQLHLSPPSVTRAIAGLEERLGTSLFQRSTRHVRLTQAGQRFLMDARRILADLDEAEASAAGDHGAPQGELSITASQMFGRIHVAPLVQDFLGLHPQVSARLLLLDRVANLIDEGFDLAVRIAHLQDPRCAQSASGMCGASWWLRPDISNATARRSIPTIWRGIAP